MTRVALVTGISGQDGSYLAELLLEKDYKVYGIVRRTSMVYTYSRLDHIRDRLTLWYGDLTDGSSIQQTVARIVEAHPDMEVLEIYNLGAQSHVAISFETPEYTVMTDGVAPLKILETIRLLPKTVRDKVRFYQAGTSEMYGAVLETPQTEKTPFNPVSPYGCAKVYAHSIVKNYRDAYGLFACNGILFNHESPRRGGNFVTMKIVNGVKDVISGKEDCIKLGNLYSKRDWGHSKDYVRGMWLMLQADKPDDYVLATGETTSVKQFVNMAFARKGVELMWYHSGVNEVAITTGSMKVVVRVDPKYFRPCEVDLLLGDASKVRRELGWVPEHDLKSLVNDMFIT
jgi:GDPmannose 4,6-dehydratase